VSCTSTNSAEGTDGGETPRVGAVGRVGRSEEKRPPSALTSIIRVEKPEGEEWEILKAWVTHDPTPYDWPSIVVRRYPPLIK